MSVDSNESAMKAGVRIPNRFKAEKRIRGQIACAECRRLKIRCDKTIPCSSCVKRGCTVLCPNGTIPPGDGSRFVPAATDHLHKKVAKLKARMHALEDALAVMCSGSEFAAQAHPLLQTALGEDDDDESEPVLKPVVREEERSFIPPVASLGILHINEEGDAHFFGPSGGSESLLLKAKDLEEKDAPRATSLIIEDLDSSYLPWEINECFQSFPFTPPGIVPSAVLPMIKAFLPPVERAIALCDIFLEHLSWMFHIVSRRQMVDELIPRIYEQESLTTLYGPHDVALMFIVLGIGSLVDLTLQPYNLEAQHYYRLARASLALQSLLVDHSVITIKVLHLMSIYNGMSGKESNLEQTYILLDLAGQIATRVGLHKDPSFWGLKGKEAYERRVYFWNLVSAIGWQSLVTGRPPSMLTAQFSTRIPTVEEENFYQLGEAPLGFGIWGFRASEECLIPLVEAVLATKPPSYQAILKLHTKIGCLTRPMSDRHNERTAITMQGFVRSHYQDLMLMFLHRGFFAQGMREYPFDPLNSPLGPSVRAAYASACTVLNDTKEQFHKNSLLCTRIWKIWSLAFSAAVIVGTVAIRGAHLELEPPPLEAFQSACEVFRFAAETSNRAVRAMPVLEVMLQKASQAQALYKGRRGPALAETEADDDELSYFAGRTRVVKNAESHISLQANSSRLPPVEDSAGDTQLPYQTGCDHDPHFGSATGQSAGVSLTELTREWVGLVHEAPQPYCHRSTGNRSSQVTQGSADGTMVDDRWSSLMNTEILVHRGAYGAF